MDYHRYTIKEINHFANDPASCYDPECSNWEKYYGPDDLARAVGGTKEVTGCNRFMFKMKTNSTTGDCMLMNLHSGFKSSAKMRRNNYLLHVGLHACKKGNKPRKWGFDSADGKLKIFHMFHIVNFLSGD